MALIAVAGCAKSLSVDVVSTETPRNVRQLVLVNHNDFSSAIRRSLIKQGFQVKAAPSTKAITEKSPGQDVTYNAAEARYGVRHGGNMSANNPCFTNGNATHFTEYEFELIDLQTNETVLFVSKGGWTEWCTGAPTTQTTDLFGDLSQELASIIR